MDVALNMMNLRKQGGGSLAIACAAGEGPRWATIPRDGSITVADGSWWYYSALRPIDANGGGKHYAEVVLCDAADSVALSEAAWRYGADGSKAMSACPALRIGLTRKTTNIQVALLQQETAEVKAEALAEPDYEKRKILLQQLRGNLDTLTELRRPPEDARVAIEEGDAVEVTQVRTTDVSQEMIPLYVCSFLTDQNDARRNPRRSSGAKVL